MTLTSASLNIGGLRIMLNEKGCLFCRLHISQEEVKNMDYAKLGAGGRGEGGRGGGGQTRCIKGEVPMANRPFPSYKILSLSKQGLLQNLSYAFCETQAN